MMQFDLPKEENSIIKVFGVGGGGSNAVNHMYRQGITGVDFYVCNTDQQALDISPIPNKIQLGMSLTEGRGAGSVSEVGKEAALENIDEIKEILGDNTKMVFITAGMGGGTGTGAAPIIAKAAKEMGILTVGIVTYPFVFEGRKRSKQADDGLDQLRGNVDTLLIICNDKLREIYGNLSLKNAFAKADDILTTAAKGIAEIITVTGYINVDFEDVRTVMTDSGVAIMGSAAAEGENRAIVAVQEALSSPLLNDNNIEGANYILLNITSGQDEVLMDEISEITDYIQDEAGLTADIIWGSGYDENLGDQICVTLIATGFTSNKSIGDKEMVGAQDTTKVVHELENTAAPAPPETKESEELPLGWGANKMKKDVVRYNLYDNEPEAPQKEEAPTEENPVQENPVQEAPVESTPEVEVAPSFDWSTPVQETAEESTQEPVQEPVQEIEPQQTEEQQAPTMDFGSSVEENTWQSETSFERPSAETTIEETTEEPSPVQSFTPPSAPTGHTGSTVVFDLGGPVEEDTPSANSQGESTFAEELDEEENLRRSQERIAKLKMMSQKMKSPSGIADLENQPAYVRRNVQLDKVPTSAENPESRLTLGTDDENKGEIRNNNSFLHDNVD